MACHQQYIEGIRALTCALVRQGDELAPRMRDALLRGELGISALSPRVTTGKEQWQDWHHDFAVNQMAGAIEDDIATRELSAAMDHEYETVNLDPNWTALHVRAPCCLQ